MAFSVNDNGTWKTVKKLSVNDGTWKNVKSGWINKNGVWTKFYSSSVVTFIEAIGGGGGSGGTYVFVYSNGGDYPACSWGGGFAGACTKTTSIEIGTVLNIGVGGGGAAGARVRSGNRGCAPAGSAGGSSTVTGGGVGMTAGGGGGGGGGCGTCAGCQTAGCGGSPGSGSGGDANYTGGYNGCYAYGSFGPYVISTYGKGGATCGGAGVQGVVRITIPTDASVSTTGAVSITTVGSNNLYLFTGNGTMTFN